MAKPASEQTVVERWNVERTLQEQISQVHDQSRANANGNCTEDVVWFNAHDLPRQGCYCLTNKDSSGGPHTGEAMSAKPGPPGKMG
jgi:hypothetical protein